MRISEGKLPRITMAVGQTDYRLVVRFVKSRKVFFVLMREFIRRSKALKPLLDKRTFLQAALGEGGHSVVWPNGIDLGADSIRELALEQNGRDDAVEFMRWRWRNQLSLSAAAEAIGISRRQAAYYASGEHSVPRHILLACKGWEVEQQHAAA
ncbi:MAG TPA: hypothetical protein VGG49_11710 [Steroidobacteraceae bacterium]|jgi:hypothetical protein